MARRRSLQGEGEEFAGHRPYRPGEDLRRLDWNLLARLDRPFVRVHRAGASESWVVMIDSSASMGVGRPGKLQSAAESAAAAMALGLRLGARIELRVSTDGGAGAALHLARRSDLGRAVQELERLDAVEGGGLESLLDDAPSLRTGGGRGVGRLLLFGDFLDVDPRRVMALGEGRRRVHLGQVFAPEEWDPMAQILSQEESPGGRRALGGKVFGADQGPRSGAHWIDPEAPSVPHPASSADHASYLIRLEAFVESWSRLARDHRMTHAVWRSDEAFEDHLPALLR